MKRPVVPRNLVVLLGVFLAVGFFLPARAEIREYIGSYEVLLNTTVYRFPSESSEFPGTVYLILISDFLTLPDAWRKGRKTSQ